MARRHANYSRQRQQALGSNHILVGGPANLNEEDVVHSNSTSTNPSLIPPNQEAGRSHRLTHIHNFARNMPVEHRAMQEVSGEIIVLYFLTFFIASNLIILRKFIVSGMLVVCQCIQRY